MQIFKPLIKTDDSYIVQRGSVCLESSNPGWMMILFCRKNILRVTLFKSSDSKCEEGGGFKLRDRLQYILQEVLNTTHQGHLKFDAKLHCNFIAADSDILVKPKSLELSDVPCCCVFDTHGTLTATDYDFWFVYDQTNEKVKFPIP